MEQQLHRRYIDKEKLTIFLESNDDFRGHHCTFEVATLIHVTLTGGVESDCVQVNGPKIILDNLPRLLTDDEIEAVSYPKHVIDLMDDDEILY